MRILSLKRQPFLPILFALVMILVPGATARLSGQAVPIREKRAELSTFVLYTRTTPDYGQYDNNGVTFGVDYSRYMKFVTPSIEFRVKLASGKVVDENTYGGGIRLERQIGDRFHPYGNFLISSGHIYYNFRPSNVLPNGQPYTSDTSVVYSYGGGLDFDVTPNFAARGEFMAEHWSLGGYTPLTLAPTMWSIGVVYRIPFKPYGGR